MKSPRFARYLALSCLALVSLACRTLAPVLDQIWLPTETLQPAPTLEASKAALPTLRPSATSSLSPAETQPPEPTKAPPSGEIPASTMVATPTPQGFYISNQGFSLVLPPGWKLDEESQGLAIFTRASSGMLVFVSIDDSGQQVSFDENASGICVGVFEDEKSTSNYQDQEDLLLIDGTPVTLATLTCENSAGDNAVFAFALATQGAKNLIFLARNANARPLSQVQAREVRQILESISLDVNQLYGVERLDALVLLGGIPQPEDLDPARTTDSAAEYTGHIYSGLVRLSSQLQVEPDLAESWAISPDGLEYTFTLRSGLKFASGKPLTAQDVKYSWERAADPATGSTTAATYLGDIEGFKDMLAGKAQEISGIQVVDERTLLVRLDGPKPYFLAKLTYPSGFVVNQENLEADPDNWTFAPDPSGPFQIKEYVQDEALVFERNPAYYSPASLSYVIYLLNKAGTSISYFEGGDIDIAPLGNEAAKLVLSPDDPLHDQLQTTTSLCTYLLQMNNTLSPLDDANVRKALALAVDKDQMIKLITDGMDNRADSVLPPAMPGFSADLPKGVFDPQAAKEALQASKYGANLPKITINASGYVGYEDPVISSLVDMWKRHLGIQVEVRYLDPEDYSAVARKQHDQMILYGWCADYPDPENFLDVLYHTDSDFNVSGYTNPEVDRLLEQARVAGDPATRIQLYQQTETFLLEDHAVVPLWNWVLYELVSPRLQGYTLTAMSVPFVQRVSLNP